MKVGELRTVLEDLPEDFHVGIIIQTCSFSGNPPVATLSTIYDIMCTGTVPAEEGIKLTCVT